MDKKHVTGLVIAVVAGLAAGYGLRSATGPHVIMDPACQGQKMAMSGGMDMMAGVDQTNPAAVDAAFMSGMVPHHEAAISASRIVIEHGEDSAVKGLAENIIKSQQSEIDFMNGWLSSHGLTNGAAHSQSNSDNSPPAGSSGMATNAQNANVMPASGPSITILSPTTPSSASSAVQGPDPNAQPNGADTD